MEGMGKMHSRRSQWFSSFIALAVVIGWGCRLSAAPINYGNFNGTNVMYLGVTEDSSTDPTPLFGPPTVTNDSLSFNPVSFGATPTPSSSTTCRKKLVPTLAEVAVVPAPPANV